MNLGDRRDGGFRGRVLLLKSSWSVIAYGTVCERSGLFWFGTGVDVVCCGRSAAGVAGGVADGIAGGVAVAGVFGAAMGVP